MNRTVVLHVGTPDSASWSRAEILRQHFVVKEVMHQDAWQAFLENNIDIVVICSSVPYESASELIKRIYSASPSTIVAEVGNRCNAAPQHPQLEQFSPAKLNRQLNEIIMRRYKAAS